MTRFALALLLPGCFYVHGSLGASTPVTGALDTGAQVRTTGDWGTGTGYVGSKGGVVGGFVLDRIPPGRHGGVGAFGLVTVPVVPHLQAFGRVTYSKAYNLTGPNECKPTTCGSQFGIALGAHLMKAEFVHDTDDGHENVSDAPVVGAAGVALSYRRAQLNGDFGHYIGLELTVLIGGGVTTSRE